MKTEVEHYNGSRNWGVWLIQKNGERELVAVTLYKKGAKSVQAILDALIQTRARVAA